MARLNQTEMRAVVDTVILKIKESNSNSPEQLDYNKKKEELEVLQNEVYHKSREIVKNLMKEYQDKYPELKVDHDNYQNVVTISTPKSLKNPEFSVSRDNIERELIIANISGNVQEMMETIINKYTNK
jgi:arginyl-tRNA synthetase